MYNNNNSSNYSNLYRKKEDFMLVSNQEFKTARTIARAAEQQIRTKTGLCVTLMLYARENGRKSPEQMLHTIATGLNMAPEDYKLKSRKTDIVELRFIGAHLLRRFYPRLTLKQIGALYGGQDHTSVTNSITRANELLYTNDPIFNYKYNNALDIVTKWLKES